jgi:flagellar motor switch protein FliM
VSDAQRQSRRTVFPKEGEMSTTIAKLGSSLDEAAASNQSAAQARRGRVVPYNFRRPDRVSKDQLRSLYLLHDTFARSLSSSLSIFLRAITQVSLVSIDQQAYLEFLHGLADPTAIFKLGMDPLPGVAALEINNSIVFQIIDRLLGGPGHELKDSRAITEIEQNILEDFLKIFVSDLKIAWKPILDIDYQVTGCETHPQLLQIVAPNEVVLSMAFEIMIEDSKGVLSFCIPAIALEPVIHKFNQSVYPSGGDIPSEQTQTILFHLGNMSFSIAAELRGAKVAMEELAQLAPGDVLRLDRSVNAPIEVTVGGVVKFHGALFNKNGRLGVKLL